MFRVKHLCDKQAYSLDKLVYLYTLVYTTVHLINYLYTELSTIKLWTDKNKRSVVSAPKVRIT